MNFKIGIIFTTFIVVKLEMITIALLYILGLCFPMVSIVINIIIIAFGIIVLLAHLKTTFILFSIIFDSNFKLEQEKDSIENGIKTRCKEEWKQIKNVSNFNFK